jgi:hypothetical protein
MARGEDLQVEVDDVPAGDHVGVTRAEALAQHRQERALGGDAGDGRRGHRWPDEEHLPRTARAGEGHRSDSAGLVGLDVEGEPGQRRHCSGGGELRVHEDQVDAAARDRLAAEGDRPGQPERASRASEALGARCAARACRPRPAAARHPRPPHPAGRGERGRRRRGRTSRRDRGWRGGCGRARRRRGGRPRRPRTRRAPARATPGRSCARPRAARWPGCAGTRGRARPVLVPGRDDEAAHLGHPGALTETAGEHTGPTARGFDRAGP